jgi:3-hydroxybutyryl-CoA dehydrogenase
VSSSAAGEGRPAGGPGLALAVLGAGTMGHGIAQVMALAGHRVRLYDPSPEALATAESRVAQGLALLESVGLLAAGDSQRAQRRLSYHGGLADACRGAELVLESVPEEMELKRRLYVEVEELVADEALICTNTSALAISELAAGLRRPERFVGTHFWNPAQIMPCVEVVRGRLTSEQTFEKAAGLMTAAGKEPVRVLRDVPGFLGNRLQHALQREALYLVEEGIASAEDVDRVVKYGFGLRLALMGPLERADLGGLDVTCRVQRYLLPDLDRRTEASPLLEERVASGRLGVKTGGGFFDWPPERAARAVAQRDRALLALIRLQEEYSSA